jgi:hypothetical protein
MTCSTHNKVRIDNSLDMTVWTRVALPVVAQDASLFWPDFATTGPHKDPVHSQASKVLVVIQQGLQFNLPAWFGTMATNGERAAGAAAVATSRWASYVQSLATRCCMGHKMWSTRKRSMFRAQGGELHNMGVKTCRHSCVLALMTSIAGDPQQAIRNGCREVPGTIEICNPWAMLRTRSQSLDH